SGNHTLEPVADFASQIGLPARGLERVSHALVDLIQERAELIGLDRLTSREVYQGALVQANLELGRLGSELIIERQTLRGRSRLLEAMDRLNNSVGPEPTHEDVLRGALASLRVFAPDRPVGVMSIAAQRSLVLLAWTSQGQEGGMTQMPLADWPERDINH